MSRFQKNFFIVALIPWALLVLHILATPLLNYIDRSRPLQFDLPADFHIVLSRNLVPATEIFHQGDIRLIRLTTNRSPKDVVVHLQKELEHPNAVAGMASTNYEYIKRDKAVKSLTWPSIPHGPNGNCYFIRHGGMTYSKFFIWPDGKGGSVIEIIEGFED